MSSEVPKRPSQTVEGAGWLENFDDSEKHIARLLIDSLRIVGSETFANRMQQKLNSQLEDLSGGNQAALFPLAEHRDSENSCDGSCDYFSQRSHWTAEGSTHLANLIVEKVAVSAVSNALVEPSLDQMRMGSTRHVFIVTDSLLSGAQVIKFANALYRNATFKSWHSYHLISMGVFAYSVTRKARQRAFENSHIDDVISIENGLDLWSAPWRSEDRAAVIELCRKYSSKGREKALGYRGSGSLVAFAHTLPNNLPLILTQTRGPDGSEWIPFAQERRFGLDLAFLRQLPDHLPETHVADFIDTHSGRYTSQAERALIDSPLGSNARADLVNLLVAIRRPEMRDRHLLSSALGLPVEHVEQLLRSGEQLNLLDSRLRPTRIGARLIRNLARKATYQVEDVPDDDEPYYPQQLR